MENFLCLLCCPHPSALPLPQPQPGHPHPPAHPDLCTSQDVTLPPPHMWVTHPPTHPPICPLICGSSHSCTGTESICLSIESHTPLLLLQPSIHPSLHCSPLSIQPPRTHPPTHPMLAWLAVPHCPSTPWGCFWRGWATVMAKHLSPPLDLVYLFPPTPQCPGFKPPSLWPWMTGERGFSMGWATPICPREPVGGVETLLVFPGTLDPNLVASVHKPRRNWLT